MTERTLRGTMLALGLAAAVVALSAPATAQPAGPGGWWGPGMMQGYGPGAGHWWGRGGDYSQSMGPWMMHPGMGGGMGPGMGLGMGPGMMGGYGPGMGWMMQQGDLDLDVEKVKAQFERWLSFHANPRIKVGNVAEKDADSITVDIVTVDKEGLVQRFSVDRKSGAIRPTEG